MQEPRPIRASHLIVLALVLCSAAFLRWYKIGSASLWTDEFLSLEVSDSHGYEHLDLSPDVILPSPGTFTKINSAGSWPELFYSLRRSNHPPLYFVLLRIWRELWHSDNDVVMRSLSLIISLIAVFLAFDAVRFSSGNTAALWAAGLLAVAVPQIQYAQEARGYALLVTLMMGCCAAIARIESLGFTRRRLITLSLCAVGMMLTHYLGFAVMAAMLLYVAIRMDGSVRRSMLLAMGASTLGVFLVWGPLMWLQWHDFFDHLLWMKEMPEGHVKLTLTRLATLPLRFFSSTSLQPSLVSYFSIVLFILPLFLLRKNPNLLLWCLIVWINVLVILVGDVARTTRGLLLVRYTLPAAAAAAVLVATMLIQMRPLLRHAVPAIILASALMTLPLSYERRKPNWHALVNYIDKNCKSDSLFVLYPDERSFAYTGLIDMALSHYSQSWGRPIVVLDRPADPALLHQLQSKGMIDVVSGSSEPADILPGCTVLSEAYYPEIGIFARVQMPPQPGVADSTISPEYPDKMLIPFQLWTAPRVLLQANLPLAVR